MRLWRVCSALTSADPYPPQSGPNVCAGYGGAGRGLRVPISDSDGAPWGACERCQPSVGRRGPTERHLPGPGPGALTALPPQDGGAAAPPRPPRPRWRRGPAPEPHERQGRASAASRGRSRDVVRGRGACAGRAAMAAARARAGTAGAARGAGGARGAGAAPERGRAGPGQAGAAGASGAAAAARGGRRTRRRGKGREGPASRPPGPAPPPPPPFAFLPCGAFRPAAGPAHAAGSGACPGGKGALAGPGGGREAVRPVRARPGSARVVPGPGPAVRERERRPALPRARPGEQTANLNSGFRTVAFPSLPGNRNALCDFSRVSPVSKKWQMAIGPWEYEITCRTTFCVPRTRRALPTRL